LRPTLSRRAVEPAGRPAGDSENGIRDPSPISVAWFFFSFSFFFLSQTLRVVQQPRADKRKRARLLHVAFASINVCRSIKSIPGNGRVPFLIKKMLARARFLKSNGDH
jgi:hypothetical protein